MQITDVRVRKVSKEGKMKAIVSITLDNEFVVHDIKVTESTGTLLIPSIPTPETGFKTLFWQSMKVHSWKRRRKSKRSRSKKICRDCSRRGGCRKRGRPLLYAQARAEEICN